MAPLRAIQAFVDDVMVTTIRAPIVPRTQGLAVGALRVCTATACNATSEVRRRFDPDQEPAQLALLAATPVTSTRLTQGDCSHRDGFSIGLGEGAHAAEEIPNALSYRLAAPCLMSQRPPGSHRPPNWSRMPAGVQTAHGRWPTTTESKEPQTAEDECCGQSTNTPLRRSGRTDETLDTEAKAAIGGRGAVGAEQPLLRQAE